MLSIVANSFWIVGLALLLAGFGFQYDKAQREQRPLRTQLGSQSFTLVAWISMVMVCIGLAGTSSQLWERILWLLFALFSATNAAHTWRSDDLTAKDAKKNRS